MCIEYINIFFVIISVSGLGPSLSMEVRIACVQPKTPLSQSTPNRAGIKLDDKQFSSSENNGPQSCITLTIKTNCKDFVTAAKQLEVQMLLQHTILIPLIHAINHKLNHLDTYDQ